MLKRFDLRSSDWPARVVASMVGIVPRAWRGTASERSLADAAISLVERATQEAAKDRELWERTMLRFNIQAEMGHLRSMHAAELEQLAET